MDLTTHSMETPTLRPMPSDDRMNLFRINFSELYRRHLCRHGQFGLNVLHVIAVYGIYFSICSIVAIAVRQAAPQLTAELQVVTLAILSIPYFLVLVMNVPTGVFLVTMMSAGLLIVGAVSVTAMPFWAHIVLILLWHRFQLWGHKRYALHRDMSEFDGKYRKGFVLFVLLAVYELPILVNYLLYGHSDWTQ